MTSDEQIDLLLLAHRYAEYDRDKYSVSVCRNPKLPEEIRIFLTTKEPDENGLWTMNSDTVPSEAFKSDKTMIQAMQLLVEGMISEVEELSEA